jgi:MscS family membrane protein
MKLKFVTAFRGYVIVLVLLLGWSLWSSAAENQPPGLRLAEPADGTRFEPGVNVVLRAEANDLASVSQIEFISDGRVLGRATTEPFSMIWSNVPSGTHQLWVRLTPQTGNTIESSKVAVRVYHALASPGWIVKLSERFPFLRYQLWGNQLWKYIFSLIYIFLAFYISKLLDFLTRVWLKKWAARTRTQFDDLLLGLLNGPIKIVSFIIFLRIGLDVFDWPDLVQKSLAKGFTIIVAVSITYMLLKFVELVMSYWRQRVKGETDRSFDEQLFPIVRKSLKVFIIVVASLVTLANVGVDITAAIASLSIGGLAIGLAAQDTLANLFGAVAVFVDKPFRIGDHIQIESVTGKVESIGMRSTRVRNLDGHLITVPNKTMGNAIITNVTRRPNIKTVMNVGLTYDTPTPKVKRAIEILKEVYGGHPQTGDLIVAFNQFANSSLNIAVTHWWNALDHKEYLAGMEQMHLTLKDRFEAEGINFAFPTQTMYLKQDSDWRLAAEAEKKAAG